LEEILRLEDRVLLPDFRGRTVAEVKQMTAAGQLQVKIFGRGRAIKQTPPPGTVFALSRGPVQIHFEAANAAHREGES
jgi:beta-lactam-binding protein with PASTA domain